MANFQIKNVPTALHGELRRRARQSGKTLRDYVLDLIRRDQLLPTPEDWLSELRSLPPIELGDLGVADAIRQERIERDDHLAGDQPSNGSGEGTARHVDSA
jgi:hypothetical protein